MVTTYKIKQHINHNRVVFCLQVENNDYEAMHMIFMKRVCHASSHRRRKPYKNMYTRITVYVT
jgi:hypothetical protein